MRKKVFKLLIVCLLGLSFGGCLASRPTIAYTVYPIEFLLLRIGGDRIDIVQVGDDTMVLRSQLVNDWQEVIRDADVFMHLGRLEPYIQVFSQEISATRTPVVDLAARNSIFLFERFEFVEINDTTIGVSSRYYDHPIFDTIDMFTFDPHLWMDPMSFLGVAEQITEWLIASVPEEAAFFRNNLEELTLELTRLDVELHAFRRNNMEIAFVSMTPSFGIWQHNYGFRVYPVVLSQFGVLPSDAQLELIKQRIVNDGVRVIVREPNLPDDLLALMYYLATELELEIVTMHNISSLTTEQRLAGADYIQLMRENLRSLEDIALMVDHDAEYDYE